MLISTMDKICISPDLCAIDVRMFASVSSQPFFPFESIGFFSNRMHFVYFYIYRSAQTCLSASACCVDIKFRFQNKASFVCVHFKYAIFQNFCWCWCWCVCVACVFTLYTNTHARWFAVFWIKAILMWRQSNRRVKDGEQTNKQASKHANREYFLCSLCAANKDINGTEMEKTLNEIKRKVAIEIAGKLANCKSKNNKKQKQQQNANNSQQWWKKIANVNQTISERMKWGSVCLRLRFVCLCVAKSWSWQKFSLQFHAFTLPLFIASIAIV